MISFYPGPSRVHDEVPGYVKDAYESGILSINHRSDTFMEISERTVNLLKSKLTIPKEYTVFYTTSATECWEIVAQSLIVKSSFHFYNGAFGRKWFEYTSKLVAGATSFPFAPNELLDVGAISLPEEQGVICLTQNETSNGTQVSNESIRAIREKYSHHLIAVDATSSMAGILLDFSSADIWFASVQKCFGLPAGLGLMVCSPNAIKKASDIGEQSHYNSLNFMASMMERWQTPFTPNVLNIYLLMRVMENAPAIHLVNDEVEKRYRSWLRFFRERSSLRHLIGNEAAHSFTVIPVTGSETLIADIKSRAKKSGFLLGEGYGELKASTFRISNFPALKEKEITSLMEFFKEYH